MKTIFITGSSSGIGKATAQLFASKGWNVIATMIDINEAGDLATIPNVHIMPLDLTNTTQIKETCQEALKKFDIDVILNNAGYGIRGPFEKLPEEEILKLFNTNVFGHMFVIQQFIPHFKERKSGVIMTTSSIEGLIGFPRSGVYGAAKHALKGLMESLYYELKPFNIQVKVMIPGGTRTNFLKMPINITEGYERILPKQKDFYLDGAKHFAMPSDTAKIMYLAATDNEDKLIYPTDDNCQRIINKYNSMNIEEYKNYLYNFLYEN
ncbi:NAD(P)-binding protein [Anaeromyces robustus]|uniref:NAD(P)-binding protein n=1 Tax=Anaeromyces robustus TaxID=1754192 RepID=A0A1Y1WTK2_9FUNG|nr:NAD(P)-binding protein [Anaeromyces robustus]|eukprot:ORX76772.1 NAD(P)-binding protein [Anaeromyces robustus]